MPPTPREKTMKFKEVIEPRTWLKVHIIEPMKTDCERI